MTISRLFPMLTFLAGIFLIAALSACGEDPAVPQTPDPDLTIQFTSPVPTATRVTAATATPAPAPTATPVPTATPAPTPWEVAFAEDEVPIPDHLERLKEILKDHEGDDKVLATVNGHDFTAQQLRRGYESYMIVETHLSVEEAIRETILFWFDEVLLISEAKARGLAVTKEEAQALADRNRAGCEQDEETEAVCRENLEAMGFDYDDYWKQVVSSIQKNYTALKAMDALREEYLAREASDAEGEILDWLAIHEVRENADVEWFDGDVEALFKEAHNERGELLEQAE